MQNSKDENEKNNEMQEETIEQTVETNIEENNDEEVVTKENDIQENIQTETENNDKEVQEENSNKFSKAEESIQVESEKKLDETVKIENNSEAKLGGNNQTKVKSISLWLLLIFLLILVLVYIFTDLLKTDEQNFAKYMYITSKNIENLKSEELENYFNKTKYTSSGDICLTTEGEELSIKFNGKTDVENRLKETNITTDYGDEELEINYKQDNDTYAIRINKLYDKYIAVENNNLKELASLLGINSDDIPNKIDLEECNFTEEEFEDIKQRYIKIIKEEINKENYSTEKNDNYKIYKLNLTNRQLNNIKIKILQELKNDNLIFDKYVAYEKMNENKIEKEDLQKEIDLKIKDLEENVLEQDKEVLVISLYTKLNKCEKIEIKLSEEIITIEMNSDTLNITSKKEDNDFSFEIQKEETVQELKYNIEIEGQNYNFDINLEYSDLSKNTVKEEYNINLNFDKDNINLKYTNTTSQDDKLVINQLENSECEILNNLNKNEINELIYKIYNNMISL